MPHAITREDERAVCDLGLRARILREQREGLERAAREYGDLATLAEAVSIIGQRETRIQEEGAALMAAIKTRAEAEPLHAPCDHQADGVCCEHPLNDLGVCIGHVCPVRAEVTAADREALAAARVES